MLRKVDKHLFYLTQGTPCYENLNPDDSNQGTIPYAMPVLEIIATQDNYVTVSVLENVRRGQTGRVTVHKKWIPERFLNENELKPPI